MRVELILFEVEVLYVGLTSRIPYLIWSVNFLIITHTDLNTLNVMSKCD